MEDGSYVDVLNAYYLCGADIVAISFQAELNRFPGSLHESVEISRLCVATGQTRNSSDVIALFVSLNQHSEFALAFHERNFTIEAYEGSGRTAGFSSPL